MSILEEALRRREAEQGGKPLAPRPMASSPPVPEPPPRRRRRRVWLVALPVIVGLGAAAFLWARRQEFSSPESPRAAPAPLPPPVPAPAAAESVEEAVPSPAPTSPPVTSGYVPEPSAPAAEASSPSPPVLTRAPVAAPHADAEPAKSPPWPRLRVQGILAARGSAPSTALVNDRALRVGDTIEGVRLVEIGADEAVFEFGGRRRRLRVGETWD